MKSSSSMTCEIRILNTVDKTEGFGRPYLAQLAKSFIVLPKFSSSKFSCYIFKKNERISLSLSLSLLS